MNPTAIDRITNLRLIENGLLHIQFEFDRDAPSHFRIAREAHLVFYRSMVEGRFPNRVLN